MNAIQTIWNGLNWSVPMELLLGVIPALLCITLHELSHGYVAWCLGDTTAKNMGRLTLNPVKHIDWFGLIMMIGFKFGWAKPVPVNMNRFQNPKRGMALTALAGPACNVLLSCVFLFLYGVLFIPLKGTGIILETVYLTAYLSLSLAVFNLLPIPPLDGSKVLFSLLDTRRYYQLMRYERYGMLLLLLLLATGVLRTPLSGSVSWLFDRLFAVAELGFEIVRKIVM